MINFVVLSGNRVSTCDFIDAKEITMIARYDGTIFEQTLSWPSIYAPRGPVTER